MDIDTCDNIEATILAIASSLVLVLEALRIGAQKARARKKARTSTASSSKLKLDDEVVE